MTLGPAAGHDLPSDSFGLAPAAAAPRTGTAGTLRSLPLFSRIGSADLDTLAARARTRALSRDEVLFRQEDPAAAFFVVLTGVIKLAVLGADGTEKVIEVIQPGESFGEAVMLLGQPYPVTATALAPTRLLTVPAEAVETLLDRDPLFARQMLAGLAVRLHGMVRDIEAYALRSGRQRVVSYLVEHARPDPGTGESGPHTVLLRTSKRIVASRLNLAPESLSRVLQELTAEGTVTVAGRRIAIPDLAALARRAQPGPPDPVR
ncbi:MAG: Crp/Fnr family transcriptional regulator [Kineosporiaceae bacterium]